LNHSFFVFAAIVAWMLFFVLPNKAMALSLNELIAKAQDRYEKTVDIKADFIQEATIKSMNKTDREEGVFYFKNPRRMVWDYTKPKKKKLVINTQTAWLYIPEDSIVYVQDAESIIKSKVSLRFLAGLGKLKDDFSISFAGSDHVDREGNFLLKLVPKERDFGVEELFLALDKEKLQITRLSFTDGYGNTTRLFFRNINVNNKLPEKFFTFIPPAGVEVYHNR